MVKRVGYAVFVLVFAATLMFGVIHFGVTDPAEATAATPQAQDKLEQKKTEFGLHRPLTDQYLRYMRGMFTLDFGEVWAERGTAVVEGQRTTTVRSLVTHRLSRTAWLWLWTGLLALPLTVLGLLVRHRASRVGYGSYMLGRVVPAVLLALVLQVLFFNLGSVLFGLNWRTFLVPTPETITRPIPVDSLDTMDGLLLAVKIAIPPALALSIPLASTLAPVWYRGLRQSATAGFASAGRAKGLPGVLVSLKHVLPIGTRPLVLSGGPVAALLVGATVPVEIIFSLEGIGSLLFISVIRNDYTTLQATVFVLVALVVAVDLLVNMVGVLLGREVETERRYRAEWTNPTTAEWAMSRFDGGVIDGENRRLRSISRVGSLVRVLRASPGPALVWLLGTGLLVVVQFGALVGTLEAIVPGIGSLGSFPTLLDRSLIPNQGHRTPDGGWAGTFLGLPPAIAWLLRVVLVYLYAFLWVGWLVLGYRTFRSRYRSRDWTPTDAVVARFRRNRVGQAGAVIVFVALVAAVFAPTLGTMTATQSLAHTSLGGTGPDIADDQSITYLDESTNTVETTTVDRANTRSASTSLSSVGPGQYDAYDRFHPFGTTFQGTDLFTEILFGLRMYVYVGVMAALVSCILALLFAGVAHGCGGVVDTGIDSVATAVDCLPPLPTVLVVSVLFHPTLTNISTQLTVWAVLFGVMGWPRLWRTARPLLGAIREQEWVESATVIGRSRSRTVARGLRQVLGPVIAYGLLGVVGVIGSIAALSYLSRLTQGSPIGLYEWGGLLSRGEGFMLSKAGHTFVLPALCLVVLLVGLLALSTGLRDAVTDDETGVSSVGEAGNFAG